MSTQVMYTRVPQTLKKAIDAYAGQRGSKLSTALVDLIERGLTEASDEESVVSLEQRVTSLTAENGRLQAELSAARTELSAVTTLSQRASHPVGSCPQCSEQISGYDLLATGQCKACGAALSTLLVPQAAKNLDQRELLILVGALGAVVGLALLAGKG